jgi:hypothetical protein
MPSLRRMRILAFTCEPSSLLPSPRNHSADSFILPVKHVGKVAFTTILSVVHRSHEDTSSTLLGRALAAKTLDLAVTVDLVVLEHGQLGLLALVLDLLGGGVDLLLALLGTTTQAEDEVEGGFLLDVIVGEGAPVFKLLAGEDQALLVRWDSFLVCAGQYISSLTKVRVAYPESCS